MAVLSNLQPEKVFYYFEKLCSVPHGSGNTKRISDLCVGFAKELGLKYRQEACNNVIIWKNGSCGYENAALVSRSREGNTTCEADTSVPGTYYYFCVVENSFGDDTKTTKSNMIEVVVQEKAVEKTIDVTLPSKNGLYEVTVYVDGTLQYGPTSVSITDGTAVMLQIPVRGKGTLPVDVYLDGAIYDSQLILFCLLYTSDAADEL